MFIIFMCLSTCNTFEDAIRVIQKCDMRYIKTNVLDMFQMSFM